ncbi:hypothetical protein DENSPDRAFT_927108 [Dentipellis sp. KUC8613]|nr:hypothetical protein DENSPDRAFT_927108 [Dentipellis sp. KUC8613]
MPTARSSRPTPPPPAADVRKRSLWASYAVLPAKTRLGISLGVCAVALAGIFVSDQLEKDMPADSTPPKP